MRTEKRKQYIQGIYATVHTIAGKCDNIDDSVNIGSGVLKSCVRKKKRGTKDQYIFYLQLNPNKTAGSRTMIKKYSDYKKIVQDILELMGIENFQITRADLALNSDNTGDYELFKKMNKLLICCLADENNIKNCYQSYDLWTNKSLSVAIKNDVLEAENYNKELESNNKVETKNRLEFRSKRIKGTLENEFMEKWFNRLDKAIDHFQAVQDHFNKALIEIWKADIEKDEKDRDFISLTAFLLRYKDCLFTRKQLEKLLELIGVEKPKVKAKNFKERHRIEFYSKTDIHLIICAIKKAIIKYFTS